MVKPMGDGARFGGRYPRGAVRYETIGAARSGTATLPREGRVLRTTKFHDDVPLAFVGAVEP
jgi:hypothetical protein